MKEKERKFVKARCRRTGIYFGLDVMQFGGEWKVVNMVRLTDEEAALTMTEVRQDSFESNGNLLACTKCGSRRVGGCASCHKKLLHCSKSMKYKLDCLYCGELEIDYSMPRARDLEKHKGKTVTLAQGKEIKVVTFSNVKWSRFDNIKYHPSGAEYNEPRVHVSAIKESIEFHGYNISAMDEGVYYVIGGKDDFEIECDVDTSTIKPHPGGSFYVSFGAITAEISQAGGSFYLGGKAVAQIGSTFHMKLSLIDNCYYVSIDGVKRGELRRQDQGKVKVTFGFKHDSHHCRLLSHAYMKGIKMVHGVLNDSKQ